jgi:CubicO group peptidase (beta-lactamase class C family)
MVSRDLKVSQILFAVFALVFVIVARQPGRAIPVAAAGPTTPTPTFNMTAQPATSPQAAPPFDAQVNAAPGTSVYHDPARLFSTSFPNSWKATQGQGYVLFTDPEGTIKAYVLSVPGNDAEKGLAAAWAVVDPTFKLQPAQVDRPPALNGVEQLVKITYATGDPHRAVTAVGKLYQSQVYAVLTDGDPVALGHRQAQVAFIQGTLDITALPKVDLSRTKARSVDSAMIAQLESYIRDAMARANVPGAEVAIVQDGKVVYVQGFGVREQGKPDPVTPHTLMMIGSVGKSMTTMMMGTVVDQGKMRWDTPAIQILPSFAVSDPAITPKLTMKDLVCNCTGVAQRDLEMTFNGLSLTPNNVLRSLTQFPFWTKPGEAFQYSNQMVAAGGYLAAIAGGGSPDHLLESYEAQMQQRIFDPIGMPETTFAFGKVTTSGNYALPHNIDAGGKSTSLPLTIEAFATGVAPAGGVWSNVLDMGRYLATQMNGGVSPDGKRVVSAENLHETWTPQIQALGGSYYGLGWGVGRYKGIRILQHSGGTVGFTSDLALMPDAKLGIVVLNNSGAGEAFHNAVRQRIIELAFGLSPEHEALFAYSLDSAHRTSQATLAALQSAVDPVTVAPYLGAYHNDALGDVVLVMADNRLVIITGGFKSELKSAGHDTYVLYDPPHAGLPLMLTQDNAGRPIINLPFSLDTYIFTKKP